MILSRINRLFARKPAGHTVKDEIQIARSLLKDGMHDDALAICRELLSRIPEHYEAICLSAEIVAKQDTQRALDLYARAVEIAPKLALAYYKRANLLKKTGCTEDALKDYDRAMSLNPHFADALCNRGVVLEQLGRLPEALDSYSRAIELSPTDAIAYFNRGIVLQSMERFEDAKKSYEQAIRVKPDFIDCYCNLALLQADLKEWQEALANYDRCIELDPHFFQAYFNRGVLQQAQMNWDAALASYNRTLELKPDHAEAHNNRAVLLTELRQLAAAVESLDAAIALRPDFAEAHYNRGNALAQVGRYQEAVADYNRAIALKPDYIGALQNRADVFLQIRNFPSAIQSLDAAIQIDPNGRFLLGMRLHAQMNICDWEALQFDLPHLTQGIEADKALTPPFPLLALLDHPGLQLKAAQMWAQDRCSVPEAVASLSSYPRKNRLRVGYFSGDFFDHPVSMLLAGVIESHDRCKFEVFGFSYGPDTQDDMRRRLERAFDRFIDVRHMSDQQVATMARSLEIDIAVDLAGFTGNGRTKIFAWRAAPLQLNFLGYPGTLAAGFMDYLVGDPAVIPVDLQSCYSEKIVYMPACFLPAKPDRRIAEPKFSRDQLGLPPSGFIYCCFNNSYKITPGIFDCWMRILSHAPDSVLWLSQNNQAAVRNLMREASRRGVAPNRLIFAHRMPSHAEHLARYRTADLFLDTLPYGAHATAIDALSAGLPIVTLTGRGFAGRVTTSLLRALDLQELVATTENDYEETAVALAANPEQLAEIKMRLEANYANTNSLDSKTFSRYLEWAYMTIHNRHHDALPPDHIQVPIDA